MADEQDSRWKRRAARIRELVPILEVLRACGYEVHTGTDNVQQFRCDLHGTGQDQKPSARVYPETNSWYCWGCQRPRDPISTVRDKLHMGFVEACGYLERQYSLPALPWLDQQSTPDFQLTFDPGVTFEQERRRLHSFLDTLTRDRDLSLREATRLWGAYDDVCWLVAGGRLRERQGIEALAGLRAQVLKRFQDRAAAKEQDA